MSGRKSGYKTGGVVNAAASADRRRLQVSIFLTTSISICGATVLAVTKERRDALLRNKRLRREPLAADRHDADAGASVTEAAVLQVVEALQQERSISSASHLEVLQRLRRLLSTDDEAPCRAAVAAGAVPLLVKALQPASAVGNAGTAAVTALEAAWALTNLAAADHDVAEVVLPAAPALMLHLAGGSGTPVAQQAAWALGNLAGDCSEFRGRLVANGVLGPLMQLATAPVAPGAVPSGADLAAACTAAWALSNVVKGAGAEVGQLLAIPGAAVGLVRLLRTDMHGDPVLASEAAWVATYLTAAPEGHILRLVEAGLLPPLLDCLIAMASLMPTDRAEATTEHMDLCLVKLTRFLTEDFAKGAAPALPATESADRVLLTPVLRTVGNVAAGGGETALAQLLGHQSGAAVPALLRCMQSVHHGIAKEAAWAVSNVAGAPGRAGVDALTASGGVPAVVAVLKDSAFDIRKEAAYALANICAGGGGGQGDAAALTAIIGRDRKTLEAMLELIRSPDMAAAALGVQFCEMVLRVMPDGPAAVEAADGIDALESLQFRGPDTDVQRMASELVDHFFGEEYGI